MNTSLPPQRQIRSFVLRQGRLTAGQERAFRDLWPHWGVTLPASNGQQHELDPASFFARKAPIVMEIGFGNGASLVHYAQQFPQHNFLGVEVHGPGVGRLLLEIERLGLSNIRILRQDAVDVLNALTDASLHAVLLFFPDPWHKKRHHKRRLVKAAFINELARVIRPGGYFHAATDWQAYAQDMLAQLDQAHAFQNRYGIGQYAPRPAERLLTKFEQRGQRLGHGVWDLLYDRIASLK
jgi:tRNA (guanine-N7-)-methyltransferase